MAPSRITSRRSATPRASGRSLDANTTPTPRSARSRMMAYLALRTDIHAARRFVQQQHIDVLRQPPCENGFLLISAFDHLPLRDGQATDFDGGINGFTQTFQVAVRGFVQTLAIHDSQP